MLLQDKSRLLIFCVSMLSISACSSLGTTGRQQPGYTSPQYEKAHTMMGNGQFEEAIPVLQAVNLDEPQLAEPYLNLGIALRKTGKLDDALTALETAIELDPKTAASHHQLGILYREMGMFDESLAAYKKSLKLDSNYALAHRNIGILYDLYLLQPKQALDHYKIYQGLTSEPDKQVNGWIIDLERRTKSARAGATQ